jgi:glycosyltransferase involved in cell wall biosynthesis
MRIAVLHSFYDERQPSGENVVVEEQVSLLREAGHDVRLIARRTSDLAQQRLYPVRAAVTAATGYGAEPTAALEAFAPDVVHCHNLFPNWGTRWLDRFGRRTVVTLHNFRTLCAAATLHRDGSDCELCPSLSSLHALRHRCYRDSLAATAALAMATRGGGRRSAILRQTSARVVLNSVAADVFRRYHPDLEVTVVPNAVAADQPAGGEDTGGWVFAGRLTEEKGVRFLQSQWPRSERLVIAGDGPLRSVVQTMAASEPSTFTFAGILDRSAVRSLIGRSEGLVLPSLWSEGLPTVVVEALSAGTPTVVSERCAAAEHLRSSAGVVTFEPHHGEPALVDGLNRVRARAGAGRLAARRTYQSEFSPGVWIDRMTQVYERVRERAA